MDKLVYTCFVTSRARCGSVYWRPWNEYIVDLSVVKS
jgi:hypothetical protein